MWSHEGMQTFPPDWPQFLSMICKIALVEVRKRGKAHNWGRENVAYPQVVSNMELKKQRQNRVQRQPFPLSYVRALSLVHLSSGNHTPNKRGPTSSPRDRLLLQHSVLLIHDTVGYLRLCMYHRQGKQAKKVSSLQITCTKMPLNDLSLQPHQVRQVCMCAT